MTPEQYLEQTKIRLDQALASYLQPEDSPVLTAMRYSVLSGGKRFRPLLLLASGQHFGAAEELLLPYACALELIHNYSLIHDDLPLMDNDDFRRGQPSCHKKFGEAMALLAGDGLLTLAFEILAAAPAPGHDHQLKDGIMVEIARAAGVRGMIGGQWLDISFNPDNRDLAAYEETALKKTAELISVAAVCGARLAGAPAEAITALERYGRYLGLSFQLRDDLQDLAQDWVPGPAFRPNLAAVLGREAASKLLSDWLNLALQELRRADIDSEILRFFVNQLQVQQET